MKFLSKNYKDLKTRPVIRIRRIDKAGIRIVEVLRFDRNKPAKFEDGEAKFNFDITQTAGKDVQISITDNNGGIHHLDRFNPISVNSGAYQFRFELLSDFYHPGRNHYSNFLIASTILHIMAFCSMMVYDEVKPEKLAESKPDMVRVAKVLKKLKRKKIKPRPRKKAKAVRKMASVSNKKKTDKKKKEAPIQ